MSDYDAAFSTAVQRTLGDRARTAAPASAPAEDSGNPFDAAFRSAVTSIYSAQLQAPKRQSAREQVENDEITKGARNFAKDGGGGVSQAVLNLLAGGVRGAGSIGATLAAPFDYAEDYIKGDRGKNLGYLITGKELPSRNEERRARIDENMADLGAQTDSLTYKGGKLGAEVAGTMGVGGAIAAPLKAVSNLSLRAGAGAIPALDTAATALSTGGFQLGAAAPANLAANIGARSAAGAATGGASAALVDPKDAVPGALIGAAAPPVVRALGATGSAIGRAVTGGGVSDEVAKMAQRAEELGIRIPADRLADSKPLNAAAASLNYIPLSGRAATEEAMESQLRRALSRTMGQNTDNLKSALSLARDNLGNKFDQFLKSNTVRVDRQFLDDLAAAEIRAGEELVPEQAKIIKTQINNILGKTGPGDVIDGQAAYNIKKTLDMMGKRSTPEAWYALDLKGKLMDALNRTVGPDEAAAFRKVRQQYSNMLELERVALNGADGNVSVARLAGMKDIRTKDLQELADIAAQFVKPREGQHGAAQRVIGATGAGGLGWVAGALGLPTAVGAVAGTMATGRAANTALNSNAARNMVLGAGRNAATAGPGRLGRAAQGLLQGTGSALPVVGAGALGSLAAPAAAGQPPDAWQPEAAPPPTPIGPTSAAPTSPQDALAAIGAAPDIDSAIAAAGAALSEPIPVPAVVAQAAPEEKKVEAASTFLEPDALMASDTGAPPDGQQPSSIWTGRRGSGYLTPDDALVALPSRQKREPDLDWRLERMRSGSYRLAGYERQAGAGLMAESPTVNDPEPPEPAGDGAMAQSGEVEPGGFRLAMNPTGTASLRGNPDELQALLSHLGITQAIRRPDGFLIGTSQAPMVMQMLQG